MKHLKALTTLVTLVALTACETTSVNQSLQPVEFSTTPNMEQNSFSVSLAVKDLPTSLAFYEKLGFSQVHGDANEGWIILRNGISTIGLFQGMFEGNIMTFNPGWDSNAKKLDSFTDIRNIQKHLKAAGVELTTETDESTSGPASFMLADPDGNMILFDQHV